LVKVPSDEDRMLRGECLIHWVDGGVSIAFAGKHWQELSVEFLTTHLDALYDFTPEAFCFYLPAYLLAAVRLSEAEAQTGAVNIQETLAYKLFPLKQEGFIWDVFEARMSLLTFEQKAAVREFLRWHDRAVIESWASIRPELAQRGEEDEHLIAMRKYWEIIERIQSLPWTRCP
jgi:hypothetical protein